MTEESYSVNHAARKQRHSSIDFADGYLIKQQRQIVKSNRRFFGRVLFSVVVFVVGYLVSLHLTYARIQEEFVADEGAAYEIPEAPEVTYSLSDSGFVLKPFLPPQQGLRSKLDSVLTYIVEPGDTLSGIAAKFGITTKTIIDNNDGVSTWAALKVGKELVILPVDGLLYAAQSNESVASIAKKFSVEESLIMAQNRIVDTVISTARDLIIPGAKKAAVIQPSKPAPSYTGGYSGEVSGDFVWPTVGVLTQGFNRYHYALDIANRDKGAIFAAANGVVEKAAGGWNGGYGNMVIIDHGNGFKTLYAHNEKLYVAPGDTVVQGQRIAWMGNSGRVRGITGIHLHFEIIYNGVKKNPLAYLKR